MLPYTVAFRAELAFGHCVGLHLPAREPVLPDAARAQLADGEIAHAREFGPKRQISWYGGRIVLRTALADLGAPAGALPSNDRGAPRVPSGFVGSISHTDTLATALVARASGWDVGIDIEAIARTTHDVSRHVLTDVELEALDPLGDEERHRQVLLRFSAKEALYKALDPSVQRFVGFKEVEAWPEDDRVRFVLGLGAGEGPFEAEGTWEARDGVYLTTARVRPAAG